MTKELENIDKFFESKIGSSEVGPPNQGWAKLSNSIDEKKGIRFFFIKSRRIFSAIFSLFLVVSWGVLLYGDRNLKSTKIMRLPPQEYSTSIDSKTVHNLEITQANDLSKIEVQQQTDRLNADKPKQSVINEINPLNSTNNHQDTHQFPASQKVPISLAYNKSENRKNLFQEQSSLPLAKMTSEVIKSQISPLNLKEDLEINRRNDLFLINPNWIDSLHHFSPGQHQSKKTALLYRGDNLRSNKLSWTLSAYMSVQKINSNISSSNIENSQLADMIMAGLSETNALEYGLRITTTGKHWYFESGLTMLEINQQEKYSFNEILINNVNYWETYNYMHTFYDTIDWYCQTGTDSIWIPIVESHTEEVSDSLPTTRVDTFTSETDTIFSNSYRYVEVPLFVGYSYYRGRFTYILKYGLITSILRDVSAYTLAETNEENFYAIKKTDLPAVCFDLYASFEARYLFGSHFYIFSDLYYRRSVHPYYSSFKINRRMEKYGLKLGVGIHF